MEATEYRERLLKAAAELTAEYKKLNQQAQTIICSLQSEGDRLLPAVADEKDEAPKTHKVTYAGAAVSKPEVPAATQVTPKRTCSVCHKPGHRAPNCPEAEATRAREHVAKQRVKRGA